MKIDRYLVNIFILIGLLAFALLISQTINTFSPASTAEPSPMSGESAFDERGLTTEDAAELALAEQAGDTGTAVPLPPSGPTPHVTPIPLASFPVRDGAAETAGWGIVYRHDNSLRLLQMPGREDSLLVGPEALKGLYLAPESIGEDAWGDVSPDGTQLALALGHSAELPRNQQGAAPFTLDLYLYEPDAGGLELLVEGASEPAWSPDGRWIAFRSADSGLWLVEPASGEKRRLYAPDAAAGHAVSELAWAPDSSMVAFLDQVFRQSTELHVVSVDGSDRLLVPWEGVQLSSPAWSPDGGQLVFASFEGSPERENAVQSLWLVEVASGQRRQLTEYLYAFRPVWAADGAGVFFDGFSRFEEGEPLYEVWYLQIAGGEIFRLTDNRALAVHETFAGLSPGNSSLLFKLESSGVWMLSLDDGSLEELGAFPGMRIVADP